MFFWLGTVCSKQFTFGLITQTCNTDQCTFHHIDVAKLLCAYQMLTCNSINIQMFINLNGTTIHANQAVSCSYCKSKLVP